MHLKKKTSLNFFLLSFFEVSVATGIMVKRKTSNLITVVCNLSIYLSITIYIAQVGKSACIVLAKERHSKGERVPFSACFQLVSKLKSEAASTLSLMFQIFLEKKYCTSWGTKLTESAIFCIHRLTSTGWITNSRNQLRFLFCWDLWFPFLHTKFFFPNYMEK